CMPLVPLPGFPVTCNQDVAEAFASNAPTEPGDLVALVLDAGGEPTVRKAVIPYDPDLVGVVSTSPGLVFDHGETIMAGDPADLVTADKTVVGIVGRLPVKVTTENGPIAVGDALTSSTIPGAAMRATKSGMIVGRALEPAASDGVILMWLAPGHYIPPDMERRLNALLAANR